jgi:HSP20 family molecular chaperone IbpA
MAAFNETKTAPCKWAQRTDTLYVTIAVPDVKSEDLQVTEKSITFKGKSNGRC